MRRLRAYCETAGGGREIIKTFGDGNDCRIATEEARQWLEENCEDRGIFEYYYEGKRVLLKLCK